MPSSTHLLLRSFLIYILTILSGTTIASLLLTQFSITPDTLDNSLDSFFTFFLLGGLVTACITLPMFLCTFLMLTHMYQSYKGTNTNRYVIMMLVMLLLSLLTIFAYIFLFTQQGGIEDGIFAAENGFLLYACIPYMFAALFYTYFINRIFDRKKKESLHSENQLLDDNLINS